MSMNVRIFAKRVIYSETKHGKQQIIQAVDFQAQQTPSDVTYQIVESDDPKQVYSDWIRWMQYTNPTVHYNPIFAPDDVFGEREPIGYEEYNWAEDHINELNRWCEEVEDDGYTVKFEDT